LRGLVSSALFIFNTSLNSDPGEPKTHEEALNDPERDWWTPASVAEVHNSTEGPGYSSILKIAVLISFEAFSMDFFSSCSYIL